MRTDVLRLSLLVFALALLVRVAGLDTFPPGLWMDEGLNGVDAWWTLHAGGPEGAGPRLVYPDVFPREPLFVWLLSVALWIGGPKVIVMRLTTVLIGSLACALFFVMLRAIEPKRSPAFALAAAFVLATLHWHAHFSRLVFRTNLVPLLAVALVWAIAVARTRPTVRRWLVAGALAGLGCYAYLSWYFFLPVAILWIWALRDDSASSVPSPFGRLALAFCVAAALVVSPLVLHYATAPADLTGRPAAISPFRDGLGPGLRLIAANARDVALMFGVRGDHVLLHNVATTLPADHPDYGKTGTPALDPLWALCFLAGIARALFLALRGVGFERRCAVGFLAWLGAMSLPSILSQTDSANTLRNLGATPAVAWFVASGWWWGWQQLQRVAFLAHRKRLAAGLAFAILLGGAAFQVHKLWVRHPRAPGIQNAFSAFHVELARMCTPDAAGSPIFVPTDFADHRTFQFLTLGRRDLRPFDAANLLERSSEAPALDHRVVCTALSPGNYQALKRLIPEGTVEPNPIQITPPGGGPPRPYAWIFRIPADELLPRAEAERQARALGLVVEH